MIMRIGHGFDIHRFVLNKPLLLGGVEIPYHRGMQAHSDGDVVLHAICDALLGAAALGDIGLHFPDDETKWQNTDSRFFLRHVCMLLQERHFSVQNIDVTVVAQVPKLRPHIESMCKNIAQDIHIEASCVNVKATTMERLGPIGQEEAIAAHAVALIVSDKDRL